MGHWLWLSPETLAAALAHGWFALQADRDLTQERG
jgi:hypothetical protein